MNEEEKYLNENYSDDEEIEEDEFPKSKPNLMMILVSFIVAALMGICFGFALEKGQVFQPSIIIQQMLFQKFVMVKMFLTAAATSLFSMSLLSFVSKTNQYFYISREYIWESKRGILAAFLGAVILGSGMSLSGSCPGTVAAQLGAGVLTSPLVLLGGLISALIYCIIEPYIRPLITFMAPKEDKQKTIDTWFKISYWKISLPIVVPLVVIVILLEVFFPWMDELAITSKINKSNGDFFLMYLAWPPYVSGIIVGILQIPAIIAIKDTLGSASSYVSLVCSVLYLILPKYVNNSSYMKPMISLPQFWQPIYLLGAVLGAATSALLSDSWNDSEPVQWYLAIIGGFFIIFGARLAGGCTSGHGLSGFAQLSTLSFIVTPSIFIGGILTAVPFYFLNFYPKDFFECADSSCIWS